MRLRLPVISFAIIAALVACSKPPPVAKDANAVTALPVAAEQNAASPAGGPPRGSAAPADPSPPPSAAVIPAALQGRWGLTPRDCTSALGDAKGLLVISPGELRFYESRAVPASGLQSESDSIIGDFQITGEGQSWTRFERLELQAAKLVRTETNPAASYTYAKC